MSETHAAPGDRLDLIGVGVGPANLSLAALLGPCESLRARFFELRDEFNWHPGLMLPDATIQVSFLKDLVTLADPTNPLSFLCFLHSERDLYSFINADFDSVTRREFNEYLRWACAHLDTLQFSTRIEGVDFEDGAFRVHASDGEYTSQNIVLGKGQRRFVPECIEPHLCADVFHASEYMLEERNLLDKRVVIVGGGQTGAELMLHLLTTDANAPRQVTWISRRSNFQPMDNSAFANELYTPEYSDYFGGLPFEVRKQLLDEQKMTSDGVNHDLLKLIYQRLYEIRFLDKQTDRWRLCPGREVVGLERGEEEWLLSTYQPHSDNYEMAQADVVILCTGYTRAFPPCLSALSQRVPLEGGEFIVGDDYSIKWDGPAENRIYVQNAARAARGVADPNLSLNAWRAARIINSIAGRAVYDIEGSSCMVDWGPTPTPGYRRDCAPREPGVHRALPKS